MAQRVKVLAAKAEGLSLIPGPHMLEEDRFLQLAQACVSTHIHGDAECVNGRVNAFN